MLSRRCFNTIIALLFRPLGFGVHDQRGSVLRVRCAGRSWWCCAQTLHHLLIIEAINFGCAPDYRYIHLLTAIYLLCWKLYLFHMEGLRYLVYICFERMKYQLECINNEAYVCISPWKKNRPLHHIKELFFSYCDVLLACPNPLKLFTLNAFDGEEHSLLIWKDGWFYVGRDAARFRMNNIKTNSLLRFTRTCILL